MNKATMINAFSDTGLTRQAIVAVILLTAIALMAYANAFNAPFVFDDRHNILENPYIRMTRMTPEALARALKSPSASRPLANLSFAVDFFLHQYDVRGYHVVNLAIHIITALLVWLLTRQTLRLCSSENMMVPFLAAILWLVNPLHTQSVTYIVQRMNSMATLFYLLALFCYIKARISAAAGQQALKPRLLYALCLMAAILGLAAKEIAATLPVIILLYEWFFFQHLNHDWMKKRLPWMSLAALAIITLAILYTGGTPLEKLREMYGNQSFNMAQRLLTESGVIIYYISLLLFPHPSRLTIDYDFPVSHALTDPFSTALAITALAMLILAAGYSAGKHRLLSFAVLWFLITLTIESSFIGLYLIFEHRTYLPSVFPVIGLTWLAYSHIRPQALAIGVLCIAITAGGIWTYQRNAVRAGSVRLWQDAADKAPKKARPYSNLGFSLLLQGKNEQALRPLSRGLELDPLYLDIHSTIAVAYHLTGDSEKALAYCRAALDIDPGFIEARNTMGFILRRQGNLEQAEACFKQVLAKAPDNFEAIMNMGLIKQQQGYIHDALSWFQNAVNINPASSKALYYLGVCLALCDRPVEAIHILKNSLQMDNSDYRAHCVLADLLLDRQEIDAAIDHYERALTIKDDCKGAAINLARALFAKGETGEAISRLNEVVATEPKNPALIWQIVLLLTEAGRFGEAAEHLEVLAASHPDNPKLLYNLACLYALQDDKDKAVNTLRKAVNKGYDNWSHLQTDKDLENIRDTTYYQSLMR